MLFSLTMFPVGDGSSLSRPVADVIDEIDKAGLHYDVTGMDTIIEGEWKDVMPVIERAEKRLRDRHERVYMMLALDDHVGVENRLHGAIEGVERELGHRVRH